MDKGFLTIATAPYAASKNWTNEVITWKGLVKRLSKTKVTEETISEYLRLSKSQNKEDRARADKIKDVGGYVGGEMTSNRRTRGSVANRQLLTLDVDNATSSFFEHFKCIFDCAAVVHGTHKHTDQSPRLRLIIPLNRKSSPEEYSAAGRKVAELLGINLFDPTTFQVERLMYWPSTPRDVEYYFDEQEGEALNVDEILSMYTDWRDCESWAMPDGAKSKIIKDTKRLGDPRKKSGYVGMFCRTYGITDAIDRYLHDVYSPTAVNDRYTYINGSTSGGLVVYDDLYAYSHHSTDPACEKAVNAYDLVRLHLFGELEDKGSNSAMNEVVKNDEQVSEHEDEQRMEHVRTTFQEVKSEVVEHEEEGEWMKKLNRDNKGSIACSAYNISIILQNDKVLKDVFKYNSFDGRRYVCKSMLWRKITSPEPIRDVDYSGIRSYIETAYGVVSEKKISDAIALEFERSSFHPIKQYLESLVWDGEKRIHTILPKYFGADNNAYTREVLAKVMLAAVTRIYKPGAKFDEVLVLVGDQGVGKSTFFSKLAKNWFSDTVTTMQGKEAFEQLQGAWIVEFAELASLKKAEIETIKHFVSKSKDDYRKAYGHNVETYPRQCVFVGTTNTKDFLRDSSGNRRWWPVDIYTSRNRLTVWDKNFSDVVDQLWAEAMDMYHSCYGLMLSYEAEMIANEERIQHSERDERRGLIERYLDILLPEDWEERDLEDRRTYLRHPEEWKTQGVHVREYVSVVEIWSECLCKAPEEISRNGKYHTRELNDILRTLPEWEPSNGSKNFNIYGRQRYYRRKGAGAEARTDVQE